MLRFGERRGKLIPFVQMCDQFGLQIVLDVVHQKMHDRHSILDVLLDDKKSTT